MKPACWHLALLALTVAVPVSHAQELPKPNPPLTPLPAKRLPLVAEDMLEARLEKVRFDAKTSTVSLEFVLKNLSKDRSIRLSERWNSFGSQQWRFEAKTAAGQDLIFTNALRDWPEDSPTVFTIAPGKEFRSACTLSLEDKQGGPEQLYLVRRSFEAPKPRKLGFEPAWSFPLKLTGHFKAIVNPIVNPIAKGQFSDGHTDWKGGIKTAEVTVTRE